MFIVRVAINFSEFLIFLQVETLSNLCLGACHFAQYDVCFCGGPKASTKRLVKSTLPVFVR
jgi:hypothetical protein